MVIQTAKVYAPETIDAVFFPAIGAYLGEY